MLPLLLNRECHGRIKKRTEGYYNYWVLLLLLLLLEKCRKL